MKYISLKKMFHINEQECNSLYLRRFISESSHKIGIEINGYECFYLINDEVLKLIDDIYEINMWLEKVMDHDTFPALSKNYLCVSTLIEEIRSTNKIEGINSTRKELKDIIVNGPPKKYVRFYGLVNKYEKLLKEEFISIETSSDIRKLYDEILLKDILDEDEEDNPDGIIFRSQTVEVRSSLDVIHKGITGEKNIIEIMDKSLKILNDTNINFLIRTAVFHYLFEYIHPFYNGNGRMGRFLASGYLSKHLNILCALQFSVACIHNHNKYYEAFKMTNDIRNKSDLTVFIIYFLEIYLSGLKELKEHIESTLNKYTYIKGKIDQLLDNKYLNLLDILLQSTFFNIDDGLTMDQIVSLTKITEQTIRKMIKNINKDFNIIKIDNANKPYKYAIDIENIYKQTNSFE